MDALKYAIKSQYKKICAPVSVKTCILEQLAINKIHLLLRLIN